MGFPGTQFKKLRKFVAHGALFVKPTTATLPYRMLHESACLQVIELDKRGPGEGYTGAALRDIGAIYEDASGEEVLLTVSYYNDAMNVGNKMLVKRTPHKPRNTSPPTRAGGGYCHAPLLECIAVGNQRHVVGISNTPLLSITRGKRSLVVQIRLAESSGISSDSISIKNNATTGNAVLRGAYRKPYLAWEAILSATAPEVSGGLGQINVGFKLHTPKK